MKAKLNTLTVADWAIGLRPIDMFMVSRYRQAMRIGAVFPALIVDKATREIISGNHRYTAAIAEYGDEHLMEIEQVAFKDRAAQLKCMAEENAKHGMPMDGITRRRMSLAMIDAGMTPEDVAAVMNVPVQTLNKWGEMTVMVIGRGGKPTRPEPVKGGLDLEQVKRMTEPQYDTHIEHDKGVEARHMAQQLTRWLENDWINWSDERNVAAFDDLSAALKGVLVK
jgi:DNA-binding transcriptional regulator YiaG